MGDTEVNGNSGELVNGNSGDLKVDPKRIDRSAYFDQKGLFKPGNPGRPRGSVRPMQSQASFRAAIREAVSPEELTDTFVELWPYAVAQFKDGKVGGFKVLLEHLCGKPAVVKEEDSGGTSALELIAEHLGAE